MVHKTKANRGKAWLRAETEKGSQNPITSVLFGQGE